ncbi:MAG: hypothetical protein ACRYGK_00650 [Janthinobacterium lividum]
MIQRVRGVPGAQPNDVGELGEIQNVARELTVPKALPMLADGEAAVSMPNPADIIDRKIAMLNRAIGERLTINNPVWSGDPIPRMRALQKRLIAYSLTLEADQRQPTMDAIRVVEHNVQMRLRWQQMYRSDLDPDGLSQGAGLDHAQDDEAAPAPQIPSQSRSLALSDASEAAEKPESSSRTLALPGPRRPPGAAAAGANEEFEG